MNKEKNVLQKIVDATEGFFLNILKKIGLKKLVEWYLKRQEAMRYLVFGVLTTVINIIAFYIFANICNLSTVVSNVIAWIVAVLFAYITNKLCVFNSETTDKKDLIRELLSFFGARIFTLVLETGFLMIFIDKLHFNDILMKVISNILVIILNFIFSKVFIFKKSK